MLHPTHEDNIQIKPIIKFKGKPTNIFNFFLKKSNISNLAKLLKPVSAKLQTQHEKYQVQSFFFPV